MQFIIWKSTLDITIESTRSSASVRHKKFSWNICVIRFQRGGGGVDYWSFETVDTMNVGVVASAEIRVKRCTENAIDVDKKINEFILSFGWDKILEWKRVFILRGRLQTRISLTFFTRLRTSPRSRSRCRGSTGLLDVMGEDMNVEPCSPRTKICRRTICRNHWYPYRNESTYWWTIRDIHRWLLEYYWRQVTV